MSNHITECYSGFMDHSPSEQLSGNSEEIHTTAIFLSKDMNIADKKLRAIASRIRQGSDTFTKWSSIRTEKRRTKFLTQFLNSLYLVTEDVDSRVFIYSATEQSLEAFLPNLIDFFQLSNSHKIQKLESKKVVTLYLTNNKGGKEEVNFLYKEFAMTLWIAKYLIDTQETLHQSISKDFEGTVGLDFFFFMDKLSGDKPERYSLLNFLIRLRARHGFMTLPTFKVTEQVIGELFVDNLAGAFNYLAKHKNEEEILIDYLPKDLLYLT